MTKTWNYLFGYVIIKIEGPHLEKFINLAITRKIDLWDIKRADNLIIAKIRIGNFSKLRPLVRKTKCSVRMLRKVGLPFIFFRLGKRKGLVAAGVFFLTILYLLSSFIWFIEIKGNKKAEPRVILKIAAQEGLQSGVWKGKLDTKRVKNALLTQIPDLAWVGINIQGTKATIQVEEKSRVEINQGKVQCLVASQDGLITQLLVISGRALVQEGDTVRKGQMLIVGSKALDQKHSPVPGRGRVKARVWYDYYKEAYLKEVVRERTGKLARALWLKVGDKFYLLRGVAKSPYLHYDQEIVNRYLPGWGEYRLPFAWRSVKYYEVKLSYQEYSLEEIKKRLRDEVLKELLGSLPPGTKITSEQAIFLEDLAKKKIPGLVRVKVSMETLEDIGEKKFFILSNARKERDKKE